MIYELKGKKPKIHPSVFVHESAQIIGDVEIGENSIVLCNAVLRADFTPIKVGKNVSVQDNVVVHTTKDLSSVTIGNNVTIGHAAILHGCKVEDNCVIGMNSVVLDNAVIGEFSFIGASTLIKKGANIPAKSMVVGNPYRILKEITEEDMALMKTFVEHYSEVRENYKKSLKKVDENNE